MILGEVEKMGKKIINKAELKEIQWKFAMESVVMNKCTNFFYIRRCCNTQKATLE